MNQELIETAARALNHAGWTCFEGSDLPGNYDECEDCRRVCDDQARAVIAAIHPTVSVWEDTDDGWFYEGSKDDEFPMSRPICRRPVVDPEYLRKQAAQFLAVADAIEGGAA